MVVIFTVFHIRRKYESGSTKRRSSDGSIARKKAHPTIMGSGDNIILRGKNCASCKKLEIVTIETGNNIVDVVRHGF